MSGTLDSELPSGDYRITPSEMRRNEYGISIGDVLSGDFESLAEADDPFHKYDVVRPNGTSVLDIFETHEWADYDWLPFSVPQNVYALVRAEGDPCDPCLVVEVDHALHPSYTIRDPHSEEPTGTVAKRIFGNWRLEDPRGEVEATAETVNTWRNLFSFSTHGTYDVSGRDGEEIARFERVRADGDFNDQLLSAMDISCSRSRVATEQCLAFAFALLHKAMTKSGGGSGSGAGD